MILTATLAAAVAAVALSELLGRGRVVYTRMLALMMSYGLSCAAAAAVAVRVGGGAWDGLAITLSVIPFMAAWLGFRIHLSNSVTLEMVTLLETRGAQSAESMVEAYDPRGHTATRLQILREAGYLVGPDDRTADTAKSRGVLLLMRLVCGPDGPRSVAAMLARRGG